MKVYIIRKHISWGPRRIKSLQWENQLVIYGDRDIYVALMIGYVHVLSILSRRGGVEGLSMAA